VQFSYFIIFFVLAGHCDSEAEKKGALYAYEQPLGCKTKAFTSRIDVAQN